jgi:putative two-component system response regulator
LLAIGKTDEAWTALQRAHAILLEAVGNLHDEGLRRNDLHDIGKVGIPDRILLKPGRFDPGEF